MNTQLVFKSNTSIFTTSLLVAEKFGKQHKHVLHSIRDILEMCPKVGRSYFVSTTAPDIYGREQPMYIMNRDGFSLLVMGFTGREAFSFKIEFIEAFNKMEKQLKTLQAPQSFAEALRLAATQAEELERKERLIEEQRPKVVFADSVIGSNNSILIREFAKDLCDDNFKIGQNRLFQFLREKKVLNKDNEPYQEYIERGYFEVVTRTIGSGEATFTTKTTKITGAGQVYFAKRIKDHFTQELTA